MSSPNGPHRVVGCDSVGVRSKASDGYETLILILNDFKKLEIEGAGRILSRPLKAHRCSWRIWCDPNVKGDRPGVGIYLYSLESFEVKVDTTFRCKHINRKPGEHTFTLSCEGWGFPTLIPKKDINNLLECDGSLEIAVDIKLVDSFPIEKVWYPKKLQRQDLLVELYDNSSSKTADVTFSVNGKEYRAHKSILDLRCKKLYDIAEASSDGNTPIPVVIAREELFQWLLEFIYTVQLPELKDAKDAMDLLVVADCYECIPLKLYIESVIVDRLITPENAAEMFLFADRYSCALLREKVITIFLDDALTVKKAEAWSEITESKDFVLEFLDAHSSGDQRPCVTYLRDLLEKAKLPLDGSREILEERLVSLLQKVASEEEEEEEEEEEQE